MAERSPARLFAPVALVAFAAAMVLVVATTGRSGPGSAAGTPATERQTGPRTYVVRRGDTLTKIAERKRVPLKRLEELNPTLDPQTLVPGQRIKLRR
jgi:hypothetical protein